MIKKIISASLIVGALILGTLIVADTMQKPSFYQAGDGAPFTISELKKQSVTAANLTETFADAIGDDLIERNPEGPSEIDGTEWLDVEDPAALADELLAAALEGFDYQSLKQEVIDSDLRIITEHDSETVVEDYLNEFQLILKRNALEVSLLDEFSPYSLQQLVNIYQQTVNELYILPVPEEYVSLHKREIELVSAQKEIFKLAGEYNQDPMQAFLALQAIEIIDQELAKLKEDFNRHAEN